MDIAVTILNSAGSRQVIASASAEHEILDLEAGDRSGSIKLVLWGEKIVPNLKKGDTVKIENGFVTSFRGFGESTLAGTEQ